MTLPLLVGNPDGDTPVTFSRFVLSFAYDRAHFPLAEDDPLGSKSAAGPGLGFAFTPISPPHREARGLYLTPETRGVLFERARWFRLRKKSGRDSAVLDFTPADKEPPAPAADFEVRPVGRSPFKARLAAPWLVLFEWPKPQRPCTTPDPLRTGFLLLDVWFPEGITLGDLLLFNEAFRYWRPPFAEHQAETGYADVLGREAARAAHAVCGTSLAAGLEIDALYGEIWSRFLCLPVEENGSRWQLVTAERAKNCSWVVDPDPRTYVWSCAISPEGCRTLGKKEPWTKPEWIKLLNVERQLGPPTEFERLWALEHTYRRWAELGSLYGYNHHAGALLGCADSGLPLARHFATIYFDPLLLLLYLRSVSFRFSSALSRLSAEALDRTGDAVRDRDWEEDFRKLRWAFGLFTNLYEFPLLSTQQQGIEMYSLARKVMDVDVLFEEVREQIQESHRYLEVQADLDEARSVKRLTTVATVGLVGGLATGFLGMNVLVKSGPDDGRLVLVTLFVSCLLLVLVVLFSEPLTRGLDLLARKGEELKPAVKRRFPGGLGP